MRQPREVTFESFARGLLLVTVGVLAFISRAQSDTWWLLRAGRDIWHDHHVSLTETWSWTARGRDWPNHEWLWEAIAHALHTLGGMPLLALANAILAVGAPVLLLRRERGLAAVCVLGAAIVPLSTAWSIRPQVASLFCLAVLLVLVRRERWAWVPVLMLVWANLHGAVATGGAVLAVLTLVALVLRRPQARGLLLVTVASAIATLVTPLGFGLWRFVLESPQRSRDNGIAEWASAFSLDRLSVLFWLWLLGVALLCLWRRDRLAGLLGDWTGLVPLVAAITLVPLAAMAARNVSFFVLATLPLLVMLLRASSPRSPGLVPLGRGILLGAALVGVAACVLASLNSSGLGWQPLSPSVTHAVEECPGHLVNTYDSGGLLVWGTHTPVFVDSRQDPYPTRVLAASRALEPGGDASVVEQYDAGCVVLPHASVVARELLGRGWVTLAADQGLVVLGRGTKP